MRWRKTSLWRGLKWAYAPFLGNTGQILVDYSGNGHHAEPVTGDTIAWKSTPDGLAVDCQVGNSIKYDKRYAGWGGKRGLAIALGSKKDDTLAGDFYFALSGTNATGDKEVVFQTANSGSVVYSVALYDESGATSEFINTNQDRGSEPVLSVDTNYHDFVIGSGPGYGRLWVDGRKRAEDTTPAASVVDIDNNGGAFYIGNRNNGNSDLLGYITYIYAWDRDLSPAEVMLLSKTKGRALFEEAQPQFVGLSPDVTFDTYAGNSTQYTRLIHGIGAGRKKATGGTTYQGTGAVSIAVTAAGVGDATFGPTATPSVAVTAAADGYVTFAATATPSIAVTAQADGTRTLAASATPDIAVTTTADGYVTFDATATPSIAVTAAADGDQTKAATATPSIAVTAVGTATLTYGPTATPTIAVTAAANGTLAGWTMSSSNLVPLVNDATIEFTPPTGKQPKDGVDPVDVSIRFRETSGPGAWINGDRCFPKGNYTTWVTKLHDLKPNTSYDIEYTIESEVADAYGTLETWIDPGSRRNAGIQWNINKTYRLICVTGTGNPGDWTPGDGISTSSMTGTIITEFFEAGGDGYFTYEVLTGTDIQAAETITNTTHDSGGSHTCTIDTTNTLPAITVSTGSLEFDAAQFSGATGGNSTPDLFNWTLLEPSGALATDADGRVTFDCSNLSGPSRQIFIDATEYFILSGFHFTNMPTGNTGDGVLRFDVGTNWTMLDDCRISDWGTVHAEGWNTRGMAAIDSAAMSGTSGANLIIQHCRIDPPRGDANTWHEYYDDVGGSTVSDGSLANISSHPAGGTGINLHNVQGPLLVRYNTIGDPDLAKYRGSSFRFDPHDSGSVDTTNNIIIDNSDGTDSYGEGIANLSDGDRVYIGVTRTGVLPTFSPTLAAGSACYIKKVTSPSVGVKLYDSAANAIAGGATGLYSITALGTDGTHSGTETSIGAATWFPNAQINGGQSFDDCFGGTNDDEQGGAGQHSSWHNNAAYGAGDDAIEAEGYGEAVSVYRNKMEGGFIGLAMGPVFKGPFWAHSNLFKGLERGWDTTDEGKMIKIEPSGVISDITGTWFWDFDAETDVTSDFTDASTGAPTVGALSHDPTNDMMVLTANDGTAIAKRTISSSAGTQNDQINIGIPVGANLRVKIGTTDGGTQVLDVTLADGFYHRVEFTHGATTMYLQIECAAGVGYISRLNFGKTTSWITLSHNTLYDGGTMIHGLKQNDNGLNNLFARNNLAELGGASAADSQITTPGNRFNDFDYCDYEGTEAEVTSEQTMHDNTQTGSAYGANFSKGTVTLSSTTHWPTANDGYQDAETTDSAALQHRHSGTINKGILPLVTNDAAVDEYGEDYGLGYSEMGVVQVKTDNDCLNRTTSVGSDSTTALLFISLRFGDATAAAAERLVAAAAANNHLSRLVDNDIDFQWRDGSNNTLVNISNTNGGSGFGAERVNILVSMDHTSSGTTRLTCWTSGGVTTVDNSGAGDGTAFDFTNANFAIGAAGSASPPGGNRLNATWYRAQLFITPTGGAPDTTSQTVRDYFFDNTTGELVDPQTAIDQYGADAFLIDGTAAFWNNDPDGFTTYGVYSDTGTVQSGTATANVAVTAAADGDHTKAATATPTVAVTAAADGNRTRTATATPSVAVTTAADGYVTFSATATSTIVVTAAADGVIPAGVQEGTGAINISISAQALGHLNMSEEVAASIQVVVAAAAQIDSVNELRPQAGYF